MRYTSRRCREDGFEETFRRCTLSQRLREHQSEYGFIAFWVDSARYSIKYIVVFL